MAPRAIATFSGIQALASTAGPAPEGAQPGTPIRGPEVGLWSAPLAACMRTSDGMPALAPRPLPLDTSLELVDQTGRIVRSGRRGAIPAHLAPILARLDIDAAAWIDIMMQGGRFLGSGIGSAVARAGEAVRRGVKWVVDRLGLHRAPAAVGRSPCSLSVRGRSTGMERSEPRPGSGIRAEIWDDRPGEVARHGVGSRKEAIT